MFNKDGLKPGTVSEGSDKGWENHNRLLLGIRNLSVRCVLLFCIFPQANHKYEFH